MHDIRAIRETPEPYIKGWDAKGLSGAELVARAIELDDRLRAAQTQLQNAQAERNRISKLIGQAMARKDQAAADQLMAQVQALSDAEIEPSVESKVELRELLEGLPNIPATDVPAGKDEHDNVEVRRWGTPFAISKPKDHADLGENLGLLDFEAAARMSGSRFVVLKGELARLERALGQFMLDFQTQEHGYTEVSPPLLVKAEAAFGTGQLPKFKEELFVARSTDWDALREDARQTARLRVAGDHAVFAQRAAELQANVTDKASFQNQLMELLQQLATESQQQEEPAFLRRLEEGAFTEERFLIPTAEVSLTNLVREQITPEGELPLRLTALTPCFRSEAGASGKDTRGMIRQHQFYKVEMVSITTPDQSDQEHERMVGCAEAVLKRLELPFRTMLLCAGDMGFTAKKTYDLEVWLPSEQRYREISSCSNCGDFQARRMDARTKAADEKGTRFVHTLNGSGLAVGRTLVALMENYQDTDGRIAIPQALHSYLPGLTHIGGKA